jgi:hypothetical protein
MKCIYCSNDAKRSERAEGKCPKCGHRFALDPTGNDTLTDRAFQAAIERVSSGGTVRFTSRHLYYELARGKRGSRAIPWVMAALTLGSALLCFSSLFFLAGVLLFGSGIWVCRPSKLSGLEQAAFERMWAKWTTVHGSPPALIVRRATPPRPNRALPQDIHHYSFDRAVVTDRSETVDLLLANNFHFENNCAVLSIDGYPPEAFDTVRAMLQNNPNLSVFVLHDANVTGSTLARNLREWGWFQPTARIVDVGLRPEHAKPFQGLWQPALDPYASRAGLSAEDARFLGQYSVELAVIRPEQIIKRLFRAMSNVPEPASADSGASTSGGVSIDSTSFSADSETSDGGDDGFG